VAATNAGRRVEISTSRSLTEVSEVTRPGKPVRTTRFMSSRVIAQMGILEHQELISPTSSADRPS